MANTSPFFAPCPHLFRPHKTLQSPQLSGGTSPLLLYPSVCLALLYLPSSPGNVDPIPPSLPCPTWNASTNLPQEKSSSNTTRLLFKLLRCHFTEAAEEKASPALCCSPSIFSAHNTNCVPVIPAAHSSCLLCPVHVHVPMCYLLV